MFQTIEVRWFGQHSIPGELQAWFELCPGQSDDQPLRHDYYLQPVGDGGLSVKLREGGLEIKQRQQSHGYVHLALLQVGLVEQWIKWRFPLDATGNVVQNITAESRNWVAVEKERQLKHLSVGKAPAGDPAGPSPAINAGCELELTSVRVGDSRYWTLGFEAEAVGSTAINHLLKFTDLAFGVTDLEHLSVQNSSGYPHWLDSLTGRQ